MVNNDVVQDVRKLMYERVDDLDAVVRMCKRVAALEIADVRRLSTDHAIDQVTLEGLCKLCKMAVHTVTWMATRGVELTKPNIIQVEKMYEHKAAHSDDVEAMLHWGAWHLHAAFARKRFD
jgi:hypothetical protein